MPSTAQSLGDKEKFMDELIDAVCWLLFWSLVGAVFVRLCNKGPP